MDVKQIIQQSRNNNLLESKYIMLESIPKIEMDSVMVMQQSEQIKEISFQLTVTRAMLETLELEQILYIILSGITHGNGLNFNRAFLFLVDKAQSLRTSMALGPADAEDAHRIWKTIETQQLELEDLLAQYDGRIQDLREKTLAKEIADFSAPLALDIPKQIEESIQNKCDIDIQSLLVYCARHHKPIHTNEARAVWHSSNQFKDPIYFRHLAIVPLVLKDDILGVILADNFYNKRQVRAEEIPRLNTLGNLAAIAIERANLYRQIKEMADLDGLTGIFNRRHYDLYLRQEIHRARRHNVPIAMLLFDIDHFKMCNDQYGHECGDNILRELATLIKSKVRTEDVVARYGGEEFVVVLTGAPTRAEAFQVAEKLRTAVESASLGGLPPGQVTISVGVSHLAPPQLEGEQLFRLADRALYLAKNNGRNCIAESSLSSQ
jgi:diguanylate cyclase (GGDEF)-like protein